MFALTFDDGPGPSTAALLDLLHEHGVRATFFILGRNVVEAPWGEPETARALALRALRAGHALGNHTYSHFRPERWRELREDLLRGEEVVRSLRREAGLDAGAPVRFRLPYGVRLVEQTIEGPAGTINAATLDPRLPVIASLGVCHQHWTSDFEDWLKPAPAILAEAMIAHVERLAGLGLDAVLDLHDSGTGSASGYERGATLDALRIFLPAARARGWQHFTLP